MKKLTLAFLSLIFCNTSLAYQELYHEMWFSETRIYDFELAPGELALTIDDGPSIYTDEVLDILERYGIKATFFIKGNNVGRTTRPIMEKMARTGHNIANHTHHHLNDFATAEQLYSEVIDTDEVIDPYIRASGTQRRYLRTPGGAWNTWRSSVLNSHPSIVRYIGPIHWNIGGDPNEWSGNQLMKASDWQCWSKKVEPSVCAWAYYLQTLEEGRGVILMHDIARQSPAFLEAFLGYLVRYGRDGKGNGQWTFKLLDELRVLDQYEL